MGDLTTSTETTQNKIPQRGAQEDMLIKLLQEFAKSGAAQSGDLSKLASGDVSGLGPTGQDQELVAKSIGASSDIAKRQLEDVIAELNANLGEGLAARGIQGSSIESVQRALVARQGVKSMADMLSGEQKQGAEALMNLPFQRANVSLNANQMLAQRLIGGASPALSNLLHERLYQGTSTTKSKMSPLDAASKLANTGAAIGGL